MSEILSYLQSPPKKFLFDGCKLLWHQDKLQDYLDGKRISPIHIDMGIHKGCNIRCIYCYGIKQKMSKEFIPEDRLLDIVNDAKDCGVKSIAIIGDGEPTLNAGLYPMVRLARKRGLDMSVATNGLLLDKDKLECLTGCLVWLRFNISAVGEAYDKIHTTKDGFKKFDPIFRRAVALGKKNGCTVGMQMVCIPECFDQVIPLAEYAVRTGADYLVIKQFSNPEEGIPVDFDMDEYDKVTERLKEAEGMGNEETKIIIKWSAMADTRSITKLKHWDYDRCIDLPFIFQISGNGGCYPCGYLFGNEQYCYGNVTKKRLRDILSSERYWIIVKEIGGIPLEKLCRGQCRHCETNRFVDRLTKHYKGNLRESLVEMCGGYDGYLDVLANPPKHINFV